MRAPKRTFLAKRAADGAWRRLTYAETLRQVRGLGQALLERGLSVERPLAILSGNDLEHALLALAALHVGVAYAPISPAYSLVSRDFGKLPGNPRAADAGAGVRRFGQRLRERRSQPPSPPAPSSR